MTADHPDLPIDPDPLRPGDAGARPAHHHPLLLLAVAAGGLLGAPTRYAVGQWLPTPTDGWPTATFLVNVAGAFVLGLLLEALARGGPDVGRRRALRLFAGTGFCGALTTYSTLAVELDLLVDHDRWGLAVAYATTSVLVGLVAVLAGMALATGSHRLRIRRAGTTPPVGGAR